MLSQNIVSWLLLSSSCALTVRSLTPARVLVYTATKGFRHDSIPTAIEALKNQSSSLNLVFDNTEDETQFTDEILAGYDAIMFVSTTGEVLDDSGKTAFQHYLNLGGNFVGVHSASDSLVNTTFYGHELGAYFDYHPALQNATVDVLDASHPSTSMLPAEWHITEEMYNFKSDPRAIGAIVLLSANEFQLRRQWDAELRPGDSSPFRKPADLKASAWFQEHGAGVESGQIAGRSFYTSLGHLNETWQDPLFMAHVTGGLTWTLQANTTRAFNASALVGNSGVFTSSSTAPAASTSSTSKPSSSSIHIGQTSISVVTGLLVVIGGVWLRFIFLA